MTAHARRGRLLARKRRLLGRKLRRISGWLLDRAPVQLVLGRWVEHVYGPRCPSTGRGDVVVLCLVRDGEAYVDAFVSHYRGLGASHLVFLDNGSTDATVARLAGHENVTVLRSRLPYRWFKYFFKHHLIRGYGRDRWSLCVDIDELFVYPGCERWPLPALGRYLDQSGFDAMVAPLLDLFPAGALGRDASEDFTHEHVCYDLAHVTEEPYPFANQLPALPLKLLSGGIRKTAFGTAKVLLTKHPLIRFAGRPGGLRLSQSSHAIAGAVCADVTGALLHYKFVGDFGARVRKAVRERNYANDSYEYTRYLDALEREPELTINSPTARSLKGPLAGTDDLVEAGFLAESPRYRAWRQPPGRRASTSGSAGRHSVVFLSPIAGDRWGGAAWGGVEKWMLTLAGHLKRQGHRVTAWGRPGSRWLERCGEAGLLCLTSPLRADFHPAEVGALVRLFRRRRVDLVVVKTRRCIRLAWAATRLVPRARRPAILCRLGDSMLQRSLGARITYGWMADAYVTPSGACRDDVLALGYFQADRIAVIPNGVAVREATGDARSRIRAELDLGPGPVLIVTSRLHPSKGHSLLLEAVGRLAPSRPALRALIVGDGIERGTLEEASVGLGLAGAVRFTGFRDDVPSLLAASDVFCLPSLYEGMPNTALEAMAVGLPVVASAVDSVGDVVADGQAGLLVPPGDLEALVTSLAKLLDDDELRSRYGARARELVRERFSEYEMLRASEAFCWSTVQRARRRARPVLGCSP